MTQQEINEKYTQLCQQYGDLMLKHEKITSAIQSIKGSIQALEEESKKLGQPKKAVDAEIVTSEGES